MTSETFVADVLSPHLGNSLGDNRKILRTRDVGRRCSPPCVMPLRYFRGIAGRPAWQKNCWEAIDLV
jgi:hypothetical protein